VFDHLSCVHHKEGVFDTQGCVGLNAGKENPIMTYISSWLLLGYLISRIFTIESPNVLNPLHNKFKLVLPMYLLQL